MNDLVGIKPVEVNNSKEYRSPPSVEDSSKDRQISKEANSISTAHNVIVVKWLPETHDVIVEFEVNEFHNWEFIGALLGMAQEKSRFIANMQKAEAMRNQQAQSVQLASVRDRLSNPKKNPIH